MRNIETKAVLKNTNKIRDYLSKYGSDGHCIMNQEDTFYKIPHGRLKLRQYEVKARNEHVEELIFYERPDIKGPKMSDFDTLPLAGTDVSKLKTVLSKALGIKGVVKKTRELYIVGQSRVHVDNVEKLGDFVEIEVLLEPDQSAEDGKIIAFDLMKNLGINQEDLLDVAYIDLLSEQRKM